jgi:hypothetical protein
MKKCPVAVAAQLALIFSVAALAKSAGAAPNGYTQIPIAKVFGKGVADLSFSMSRLGRSAVDYETQYGLTNEFEIGLDYQAQPTDDRAVLANAKYLLLHRPGRLPDVAVGVVDIASNQRAQPYLVATTQPGAIGFSLGVTRPNPGGYVGMGGFAYNINADTQLVADYISGSDNYSTYGIVREIGEGISVNVAYARPNTPGDVEAGAGNPRGFVFNVAYTFHALRSKTSGGDGNTTPSPASAGK